MTKRHVFTLQDFLADAKAAEKASIAEEERIEATFAVESSASMLVTSFDEALVKDASQLGSYTHQSVNTSREFPALRTEPTFDFLVEKKFAVRNETHTALAMDYCPGGELFMLLRAKKHFSIPEAQFYAASILQGLEALHTANIVYRE